MEASTSESSSSDISEALVKRNGPKVHLCIWSQFCGWMQSRGMRQGCQRRIIRLLEARLISFLCSQIQKDYEEVIRDETVMASQVSQSNCLSTNNLQHTEINSSESRSKTPDLISSDDSDCGVIDGQASKKSRNLFNFAQITPDLSPQDNQDCSDSQSLLRQVSYRKRVTTNELVDMDLTGTANKESPIIQQTPPKILRNSTAQSTTMSSLRLSSESSRTKSGLGNSSSRNSVDKENKGVSSIGSTMSSLRISDSVSEKKKNGSKSSLCKNKSSASIDLEVSRTRRATTMLASKIENSKNEKTTSKKTRRQTAIGLSQCNDLHVTTPKKTSPSLSTIDTVEDSMVSNSSEKSRNYTPVRQSRGQSSIVFPATTSSKTGESKILRTHSSSSVRSSSKRSKEERSLTSSERKSRRLDVDSSDKNNTSEKRRKPFSVSASSSIDSTDSASLSVEPSTSRRLSSVSSPEAKTPKLVEQSLTPAERCRVKTPTSRRRKLFNPDDVSCLPQSIEAQEREEFERQKTLMKSSDTEEGFLDPNILQILPPPKKQLPKHVSDSEEDDIQLIPISSKKKKKKQKQSTVLPRRDSSADEQRELLVLLTVDKTIEKSQRKPEEEIVTPVKRRSTMDFMQASQQRRLKLDPQLKTSIVCTKMHRAEVVNFQIIVKILGKFFTEDVVTDKTSHLVAGEERRTINMLRAIARGCWIVKHDWLLDSKEAGRWLPEENYEVTDFSPAVQQSRVQRQAFGQTYVMDIFKDMGYIFVAPKTIPQPAYLKELILTCQGQLAKVHRNANVIVGELMRGYEKVCVTEQWVLDSITYNKCKSLKNYLISPERNSPSF